MGIFVSERIILSPFTIGCRGNAQNTKHGLPMLDLSKNIECDMCYRQEDKEGDFCKSENLMNKLLPGNVPVARVGLCKILALNKFELKNPVQNVDFNQKWIFAWMAWRKRVVEVGKIR